MFHDSAAIIRLLDPAEIRGHGSPQSSASSVRQMIYITNRSLDGYVEDETGAFDWVIPDHVQAFVTELLGPIKSPSVYRRAERAMWSARFVGAAHAVGRSIAWPH